MLESSQTFVKTVCPAARNVKATEDVGQPVPVLITNRNTETGNEQQRDLATAYQRQQSNISTYNAVNYTGSNAKGKLLLIGDSILNSINTKGLVKGVLKHSKGGAKIQDLIEDISVYDMRNFETCIIYIGVNYCAKQTNLNSFVDAYDQLISLIKTTNPACKVYLCKIAPRRDVDVSGFNKGIERLSKDWERRKVYCMSNTNSYFFDRNLYPANRYFNSDGIHLSNSGTKRLLDVMNIVCTLSTGSSIRTRTGAVTSLQGTVEGIMVHSIDHFSRIRQETKLVGHQDSETLGSDVSDVTWLDTSFLNAGM